MDDSKRLVELMADALLELRALNGQVRQIDHRLAGLEKAVHDNHSQQENAQQLLLKLVAAVLEQSIQDGQAVVLQLPEGDVEAIIRRRLPNQQKKLPRASTKRSLPAKKKS